MKLQPLIAIVIGAGILLQARCAYNEKEKSLPFGATRIMPSPQREGDPEEGYRYLIYGDYVSSGVPLDVFHNVFGGANSEDLGRSGDNAGIPYRYNVITASNGVKVVAPTCLTCHAEKLNGNLIVGLGNNTFDYTSNQGNLVGPLDAAIAFLHGQNSPEFEAYAPFRRGSSAIGPNIITKTKGVNPADKIFAVVSVNRDKNTLSWLPSTPFVVPTEVVPTDVPAWWLMKKKNALYYNGLGTGDFARLSMASGLLTMADSTEARKIDNQFANVMAWIRTLMPPQNPNPINTNLAQKGRAVFEKTCAKCHGTYGDEPTYPNLLIDIDAVGTDQMLANQYRDHPEYHTWYNESWFSKGPYAARLEPTRGYVAPPLDGLWTTAPYLHNGSVPTLAELLNSPLRPKYWKRSFNNSDYDLEKVGWKYELLTSKKDKSTYDTTLPGYGNMGHTFGDPLSDPDRKALIEYLKTL